MVNKLKAAVIGCGRMGAGLQYVDELPSGWIPLTHAEAIRNTKTLDLAALCDIDSEALKKAGNLYNICAKNQYNDYKNLIDDVCPDIVTVATRTPSKKDIIHYACTHGVKGIYIEKPLANSLSDCKYILNLVKEHDVKMVYGVNRRYHITYQTAKKLIYEGAIGNVLDVTIDHGKSLLLWTHPHSVDMILYFLGTKQLENIQASMQTIKEYTEANFIISEDPVVIGALFKFSNGLTGKITNLSGLNVKISGSDGYLIIHGDGKFIEIYTRSNKSSPYFLENKKFSVAESEHKATVFALDSLSNSIIENSPLPIKLDEISLGMRMLFGSMWSYMNNGVIIPSHEVPENLVIEGIHNGCYA